MARTRTRLAEALSDEAYQAKVTPVDVFKLARQWWLEGRRLNLGALADEVGVSRATVFRWVGSKELLVAEILWSLYLPIFDRALAASEGEGIDRLVDFYRRHSEICASLEPLRRFLKEDPQYALRVLLSDATPYHERLQEKWTALIAEETRKGSIRPRIDPAKAVSILLRFNEACLYNDLLADREPAIEEGCIAVRLLLSGG